MEYILQDTDIFDENIGEKFSRVIKNNKDVFIKGKNYSFIVSFHVNLLHDARFESFNIDAPSKINNGERKDKIYDVMSFQLKKLEQVLEENGIEVYSTTIQGDNLKSENIIKIGIIEDTSEPSYSGRGKNRRRIKVSSIIPSLPYTQEKISKFAGERLSELFYQLMYAVKDKRLMSEILEIETTEDDQILFEAFVERYGDLWLTTSETEKELLDQLKERCLFVVKKYFDKD
ncbi:hypothetical protein [Caloranaerobacter ferrireducens]|uniref:hypothetical protein n=1 Tax=Caloranaerobacter ferrireducens TaxID=1323370 RepID=UPI0009F67502|nr:hypothetical protein [Caloranaerobacter ferrireducens]